MGNLSSQNDSSRTGPRGWGAVVQGVAAVGPSSQSPEKKVLVQTQGQEYLPSKPRFGFEVSKSKSQGIKAQFAYRVTIKSTTEFWLTVTRIDVKQGWDHDLHLRWSASGGAPKLKNEPGYDEEVAQMIAMGYDEASARQALLLREGDLGAAASFLGACDVADDLQPEQTNTTNPDMAHLQQFPIIADEPHEHEMAYRGESAAADANPMPEPTRADRQPMKNATAIASMQSMLEPEPIGGWGERK
jgi:hypothetical protein